MPEEWANANPNKRFFLEMFTRDISLEGCILDLIDNSIDSYVNLKKLFLKDILIPQKDVRKTKQTDNDKNEEIPTINIKITPNKFIIQDNCGGITFDVAQNEIFKFGHSQGRASGQLGVYGIGLKRAIFKMGRHIVVESLSEKGGFISNIDSVKWLEDEEWRFPLKRIAQRNELNKFGTTITITSLHQEISDKIKHGSVIQRLSTLIAQTYGLFIDNIVKIKVNNNFIEKAIPSFSQSKNLVTAVKQDTYDGIDIRIYAGLAAKQESGYWKDEFAGWYIACNGRIVVYADKGRKTGWVAPYGPTYQPQYRGFLGVVLFFSDDPLSLPWTTTKRDINQESRVYMYTLGQMSKVAMPVRKFQRTFYSINRQESKKFKDITANAEKTGLDSLRVVNSQKFIATPIQRQSTLTSVQFHYERDEIERIKRCLKKSSWSNKRLGKYALEYLAKAECPE